MLTVFFFPKPINCNKVYVKTDLSQTSNLNMTLIRCAVLFTYQTVRTNGMQKQICTLGFLCLTLALAEYEINYKFLHYILQLLY